jgi:hypothetical protein
MSGNLSLFDTYGSTSNVTWTVMGGSWQGQYTSSLYWGTCYTSAANAQTFDQFGQSYGNATCNPDEPTQTDPSLEAACGADSSGCAEPLLINLGNEPYQLTGLDDPVSFDINADGHRRTIGWTGRNGKIAFVAIDLNGNGTIDNGSELFGNASLMRSGARAANGFDALSEYDNNGDGVIDDNDPIWPSLILWTDRNHNGVSEPDELEPIAMSQVTGIYLAHHWMGRRDSSGNFFGYQGHVKVGNGLRVFYDVFFVTAPQ